MVYFSFVGYGFVIVAAILSMVAQGYVQSQYAKYRTIRTHGSMTGADVARLILKTNNITNVQVIRSDKGTLSDHYDPRSKTVALSPEVYDNNAIASVAVAAHEVGHAIQHATNYGFIGLRNRLLPAAILGNRLSMVAAVIGIFSYDIFLYVGIAGLILIALFQLVTLPVEFNASSRALKILETQSIVAPDELKGAKSMLSAAALTYVAALVSSLLYIMRYLSMLNRRR